MHANIERIIAELYKGEGEREQWIHRKYSITHNRGYNIFSISSSRHNVADVEEVASSSALPVQLNLYPYIHLFVSIAIVHSPRMETVKVAVITNLA
jgi:hypothetical protein